MINTSYFRQTVEQLGETLVFDNGAKVRSALKYSTAAVFNLSNRAYYIEGQTVKSRPMFNVGDYFVRKRDKSGKKYFVSTIQFDACTDELVYMFAAQCNAEITVTRYIGKVPNEDGDLKDTFETVCENQPVYRDFTTRSSKQTNDGLIDQAIYTLLIPHKFLISEKDRVVMKYNEGGKYIETNFYVENVACALADGEELGIDSVQLSRDNRTEGTTE